VDFKHTNEQAFHCAKVRRCIGEAQWKTGGPFVLGNNGWSEKESGKFQNQFGAPRKRDTRVLAPEGGTKDFCRNQDLREGCRFDWLRRTARKDAELKIRQVSERPRSANQSMQGETEKKKSFIKPTSRGAG